MNNYLYDRKFLKELDLYPHKEKYIRITSLDDNDLVRESLEGVSTGGSVNIDGASAIRRSCNLTISISDTNAKINDSYWAFNNKFKLEIGLKNEINVNYPPIIWFKQGVYIVNSYSRSESPTSININISGQDKMCRLNGTISGALPHEVAFGVIDEIGLDGALTTKFIPLKQIIREAVKEYAQERDENIIINDLDIIGYELWAYRGTDSIYIFLDEKNKTPLNMTFDSNLTVTTSNGSALLASITPYYLNSLLPQRDTTTIKYKTNQNAVVAKIETGQVAGYHPIELVPSSELIMGAGSPLTSLLDAIKNQLGEFEYFYDLDGRFVFQKKQNYIQELFSPLGDSGEVNASMITSKYSYVFDDNQLLTAFSEAPKIDNVKNDYSIWGSKKGVKGDSIPIHLRFAIDKKPQSFKVDAYTQEVRGLTYLKAEYVRWTGAEAGKAYIYDNNTKSFMREYNPVESKTDTSGTTPNESTNNFYWILEYAFKKAEGSIDGSAEKVIGWNATLDSPVTQPELASPCPTDTQILYQETAAGNFVPYLQKDQLCSDSQGLNLANLDDLTQTIYYFPIQKTTVQGEWREVIYQMALEQRRNSTNPAYAAQLEQKGYAYGKTGYEQYYSDLLGYWRTIYDPDGDPEEYYGKGSPYAGWNRLVVEDPSQIVFWFDFLEGDPDYGIGRYSVPKIGQRIKTVNDNQISTISSFGTPEVQFRLKNDPKLDGQGTMVLTEFFIPEQYEIYFSRSAQGPNAIDKLNSLIFQHGYLAEAITLTSIPIYYLEPNTRVRIRGKEYVLDKISHQLNYNGTMSLTCTKIPDSLI